MSPHVEPWTGTARIVETARMEPRERIPVRYWPAAALAVLGYLELGPAHHAGSLVHYEMTFRPAELLPGEEPVYELRIEPQLKVEQ